MISLRLICTVPLIFQHRTTTVFIYIYIQNNFFSSNTSSNVGILIPHPWITVLRILPFCTLSSSSMSWEPPIRPRRRRVWCSISSAHRTTRPSSPADSIRQIISPAALLSSFADGTGGRVNSGDEVEVRLNLYPAPYLALSRRGVPAATISPFCITIMESANNLLPIREFVFWGGPLCFFHWMCDKHD